MHEAMVHRLALHHLTQHHLMLHWQSFARWEDLPVDAPDALPSRRPNALQGDGQDADLPSRLADPVSKFDAWGSPKMAEVIIMEVHQLRGMCIEMVSNLSQLPIARTSNRCIRIVWSWGALGRLESLETADFIVPMASLAHGLIHNAVTLNGWIRNAVVHARNHPSPPHPLLQDLSIPYLAL